MKQLKKKRRRLTASSRPGLTFQELVFTLSRFWAEQGCIIQQPYDLEVGAGTMHPETFLRVLGPEPYSVAYVQPSRRPADGRYGENPNRLYKHTQFQVVLKPAPDAVQDLYLASLEAIGIKLRRHDIRFEEDNWEAPTLGAWGVGWQVLLDGLEITQFTYFQQCGGLDLGVVPVELTYGLERIAAFLQHSPSAYELAWNQKVSYGQVRWEEEVQFSAYSFDWASIDTYRKLLELQEQEAHRILESYPREGQPDQKHRHPILAAYDLCLKCSHLFNLLDARGAISTTERAALIGRVRALACRTAECYLDQKQTREQRS